MHSFQRSRAMILFEVACALALSASFAAAWQQTGAPALIAAAAVAGLYGLVHLFDLRQRQAGAVAAPVPVEAVAVQAPSPIAEPGPPEDLPASKPARAKAPRKGAKAAGKPKLVAEPAAEPVAEPVAEAEAFQPATPIPLAPLFEPEPFVRQQRAFGRKAG